MFGIYSSRCAMSGVTLDWGIGRATDWAPRDVSLYIHDRGLLDVLPCTLSGHRHIRNLGAFLNSLNPIHTSCGVLTART